ncbi:MAG: enoyl-CoA hydratase/isomerase family protein [Deltaproteobacteria bacterium]|nr:enoyl-CoA hydratase/isomerase family protein [Deltaproteobacteria bacterium]MBW2141057.1 enoyl-CoA hydratase/isomerase family protein [Deltaproteobacteria bacterium]
MSNEALEVEKKDYTCTLILNRQEKRNSVTPQMLIKLYQLLDEFSKGDDVRVVVFRGAGDKAFCAGYDIGSIPTEVSPKVQRELDRKNPVELALECVKNFPYPTIAMMNGYTFGAGFNLAMCCDIRIAVDDIRMGMPPARLGLVYHPDGIKQFIDVLGMARAKEVFLTARTYQGVETKEKGLVDFLVPRSELESFTYQFAEDITKNAPLSLKGIKKILNMFGRSWTLSEEDLKEAEALIRVAFASQDLKEGQAAFLQKRKPKFIGK